MSPTNDFSFSDNLTWIKGDHTLKCGGLLVRNLKDQNGRTEYAGNVTFNPTGNTNTTGNAFADALLGNFRTYQEAQLDPMGYFRFWQFEAFVSDAWRLSPKLSIEFGMRYAWQMPTLTDGRNTTSFDPALYNPAQAVTMNTNGTVVAGTGNRFNGLTRPGEVPSDQLANVPNANSPFVALVPFADNEGYYGNHHTFAPRFSFAYSPTEDGTSSVRGGFGLFYDRPEGNLYFSLVNNPPFALSSEFQNGNLANPGGGTAAPLAPWSSMDALDPNLSIPKVWNWSLSYQRELGWGLFGEVSYIGAKGLDLIRQPDINLASLEVLAANAAGPNYNTNYLRPYKGYSAIRMRLADAESTYNALQVFLSKRQGDLYFTLNYTLSKSEDHGSSNTDQQPEGYQDLEYLLGGERPRPPARLRRHLDLPAAVLPQRHQPHRVDPWRVGSDGRRPVPVGRPVQRQLQLAGGRAPGRLQRPGRLRIEPGRRASRQLRGVDQHGRVRCRPQRAEGHQRAQPVHRPGLPGVGHLAAQGLPDLQGDQDPTAGRLLQCLQPGELQQPIEQPEQLRFRHHHRGRTTAAGAVGRQVHVLRLTESSGAWHVAPPGPASRRHRPWGRSRRPRDRLQLGGRVAPDDRSRHAGETD